MRRDIETASYYELLAWCRELGLEDSGARQVLQQRLVRFYGLEEIRQDLLRSAGRILEIRSATETEYFTIEEIDEDYVLLRGDVLIELREKEAVHRIRAERILLNQTASLLTAEGGIEYTLIKGAEEEVFRGEKLTFDIEDWEGVFFRGEIEAERPIGGKAVRFRFEGQTISRLGDDTVVIDRGTISSCDLREDPHYQVRARKIWVLAPGEWAILNAVLYVGRVPILYLPFYFRPGDEFFFHPAFGIREREGTFLQTTSYLVGRKPRQVSALSFLAATEESTVQYKSRVRGLFLRPVEGEVVDDREDRFLKILLDAYSRLGLFAGISGNFPPAVRFQGGLGFSRNIYYTNGVYVPYREVAGRYDSVWNQSRLFGASVPFRYGLDADWSLGRGVYALRGKFEHYSDPLFLRDFFVRSEDLGLTRLAGLEGSTEGAVSAPEKQALSWELSASADFSRLSTTPLVNRLAVPYLNANLVWQSREDAVSGLDPEDPGRRFYYPALLRAPSASLQIGGRLLRLPRSAAGTVEKKAEEPVAVHEPGLRAPRILRGPDEERSARKREDTAAQLVPEEGMPGEEMPVDQPPAGKQLSAPPSAGLSSLRPPARQADLQATLAKTPLSVDVTYQVRPNLKVEQTFDSEGWDSPAEVDGDVKFTSLDSSGTTSLDYNLRVLENVLVVGGSLLSTGSYRTSFDQGYGDPAGWAQLTLGDYRYSQFNVRNTLNATLYPLAGRGPFGASTLAYALGWTLFRYSLDGSVGLSDPPVYTATGPEWTPAAVSRHTARAQLAWRAFNRDGYFTLGAQLPPRDGEITADLVFQVWLLRTTINSVFRESVWDDTIPLVVQEQLELSPNVRLTQELRFDLVPGVLTRSLSSVNLWGFSASYTADRLSIGGPEWGSLEPSLVSAAYRLAERDLYLWKDRIQLQAAMSTGWTMNLRDPVQNNLDFVFTFKMFVHEFLELAFTSISYNNRTFRYFRGVAEELGVTYVNPVQDLLRSFNFANPNDRLASAFKLRSINLTLIHHLHDWDLTLQYTGRPELTYRDDPRTPVVDIRYRYEWRSSFSVMMQWIPIPEMRSTVRGERLGEDPWDLSLRGDRP